jgi:hypothetical protein
MTYTSGPLERSVTVATCFFSEASVLGGNFNCKLAPKLGFE